MKRNYAIALVVGAVLAGGGVGWAATHLGDEDPKRSGPTVSAPPTTSEPTATEPTTTEPTPFRVVRLSDADLITVGAVPAIPSEGGEQPVGTWQQVAVTDVPTLPCQAAWLNSLNPDERLTREFRSGSGINSRGAVNTAVLRFADEQGAATAYDTIKSWITSCRNPLGFDGPPTTDNPRAVDVDGGRGYRADVGYSAPEICDECDAMWFAAQVIAQVGDRLILVTYAEVGGPLAPEYASRVSATVTAAFRAGRAG